MLAQLGILVAIQAVLAFTILGSIPMPTGVVATLAHLPAIIAGMLLGVKAGAFIGFSFGLFSFMVWTFTPPSPFMAFMFTPFWAVPGELVGHDRFHDYMGNFGSILICFVPRILVGVFAALAAKHLPKKFSANYIAGAIIGSLTNTLLVVAGMFIFFSGRIEPIWGRAATAFLGGIITGNGISELIIAAIVCPAIVIPLKRVLRK